MTQLKPVPAEHVQILEQSLQLGSQLSDALATIATNMCELLVTPEDVNSPEVDKIWDACFQATLDDSSAEELLATIGRSAAPMLHKSPAHE